MKLTICIMAVLLVGIALRCSPGSSPSILFSGFRDATSGQVAVFLITNGTSSPYSYSSYGLSSEPFDYVYRVRSGAEWKTTHRVLSGCEEGHVLPPHTSFEFAVKPPFEPFDRVEPFGIGVEFYRGTPDEIRHRNANPLARCLGWLRYKANPYSQPDYTWSQLAKK